MGEKEHLLRIHEETSEEPFLLSKNATTHDADCSLFSFHFEFQSAMTLFSNSKLHEVFPVVPDEVEKDAEKSAMYRQQGMLCSPL